MKRSIIVPAIIVALLTIVFFWKKPFTPTSEEAQQLHEEGKYSEALAVIEQLLYFDPDDELLLIDRGVFKSDLNDQEGAMTDFNRVLSMNPGNDAARLRRASTYNILEEYENAMIDLEYLLEAKRKGTDVSMWTEKLGVENDFNASMTEIALPHGIACAATDRFQEAYNDFSTCINHQYQLSETHYRRGEILIILNDKEKGCADIKMSIELGHPYAQETFNEYCN
ncbi:MAG: hypothetical protein HRT58_01290 [Crocinitomicaceae bacterium]|nr:tetratricopeptide repeat protein [Flavobacteriales bacterium]NQZ34257.1 hypothetical protein [Crocinitomicaceae bacterium]PHR36699.1 MAG: hypothetical protein COA38_01345 [Fluviicola sp.]